MKQTLSGIIQGISNIDYHAHSALSSTGLRELAKSPAHFQAYKNTPREPSQAMLFGTGFHELIGEPQLFAAKYVKAPEGIDKRTKIGKETFAAFEAANVGKTILSHDEYDRLDGMLSSILKHKTALALLTEGVAESSIFWQDPKSGVQLKCRPDWLRNDGVCVDLKTTEDASVKGFQKSVSNYGYHLQSSLYMMGVSHAMGEPLSEFVHVCCEKKAPYAISIYTLDDAALIAADAQIEKLLTLYAECSAKNEWPGFSSDIQNVSLPNWMYS